MLLDSGVWVSAINSDQPWHEECKLLIDAASGRGLLAYALDLTVYEVVNVAALKWGSVSDAERVASLVFESCPERVLRVGTEAAPMIAVAAQRSGLTAYDAAYVAAAEQHGLQLISTDIADLVEPGLGIHPGAALELLGGSSA